MKKYLLPAILAGVSLASVSAQAATATGSFGVSMTITANCRVVSANNVSFGSSGIWTAAVDASATFDVQCTNSTPYNVGLDLGANETGTTRRMVHGTDAAQWVNYELYSNAGRTVVWGDTVSTDTVAGTGNGTSQTLTVYGRVPVQTVSKPGAYSDTITITITY
jgi:spore coat protein U domain-containing protein, fimbrial subunit CupE1/2/3/6